MSKSNSSSVSVFATEAKELFLKCLEPNGEEARERLLEAADPGIRQEVRRLLKAREQGRVIDRVFNVTFAEDVEVLDLTPEGQPSSGNAGTNRGSAEGPGSKIGNYKLLEQIGEGGMGTVFMAQQTEPVKRRVAVKIIKPGMDSRQVVARFEAERQALALMDHPNIARVFDGGETEHGRPYFVMELVKGVPLTDFCQRKNLTLRERLELFADVCSAVQHAHQRGIIHRDLKPSNVMVTLHDDSPVVKIIDFGIAKAMNAELTDKTLFTQFATMVGTPLYMSPEQAELSGLDVDTRSDVYSLGVMLYELLTGTTPFDRETLKSKGLDEVRRMIRETEPPKPSLRISTVKAAEGRTIDVEKIRDAKHWKSDLSGELDWIVMRAIEKSRDRRYQSARDFADDLHRFLNNEPVEACPPSVHYQLRKYVQRNRGLLTATSLVLLVALSGSLVSYRFALKANESATLAIASEGKAIEEADRARRLAAERDAVAAQQAAEAQTARNAEAQQRRERQRAEQTRYRSDIRNSQNHLASGKDQDALDELLDQYPGDGVNDYRKWEWYYLLGQTRLTERTWQAHDVGISATWVLGDSKILTTGRRSALRRSGYASPEGGIWDVASNAKELELEGWMGRAETDNSGRYVATSFPRDNLYGARFGKGVIQVLDVETRTQQSLPFGSGHAWAVAWSPQGDRLAGWAGFLDNGTVAVWRRSDASWVMEREFSGPLLCGWNHNGEKFAWINHNDELQLCDGSTFETFKKLPLAPILQSSPFANASQPWHPEAQPWHPHRDWVAMTSVSSEIVILDTESEEVVTRIDPRHRTLHPSWSPDGRFLASAGDDGAVRIWSTDDWRAVAEIAVHRTYARSVQWSRDSRRVLTMGEDGRCSVWELSSKKSGQFQVMSARNDGPGSKSCFWENEVVVRWINDQGELCRFDTVDRRVLELVALPAGEPWQLVSANMATRRVDVEGNSCPEVLNLTNGARTLLRDLKTPVGRKLMWGPSKSGQWLVVGVWDGEQYRGELMNPHLIDLQTATISVMNGRLLAIREIDWSPDDSRIGICGSSGLPNLQVFDPKSQHRMSRRIGDLGFGEKCDAIAWSPDGTRIAAANADGRINILDTAFGSTLVVTSPHQRAVTAISWHPTDDRIVSSDANGRVVVWDPGSGETILSFELSDSVTQVAWSPDGRRLLAKQAGGVLTIWDSTPGIEKVQSSVVSDMLSERIVKAALLAERNAYMFFDEGEYELAFKQLDSWMKKSASEDARERGQFRLPKSAVFAYYLARGFWAVQQERINDAANDFRAAALTGQDDLQAITQLAELIASGADVEDFDRVAKIAFESQTKRNDIYRETIAVTAIASVAEKFCRRLANNLNKQASILRTAGTSIKDVIEIREQAIECAPEDAELLHQLADDYYVAGDFQKAIRLQQRVIALRPEWDEAKERIRKYERAKQ